MVQVTTDPADDAAPALVQTGDGNLLAVFVRNGNLWSRASTDDGATWATEKQIDGCCRYNPSLARAANGTLWLAYDRDGELRYRTSADHGVTWTTERKLPTDPNSKHDYDPVIFQAVDGKLWVVWYSYYRADYYHAIWYKTSADGGVTWSADTRLTSGAYDEAPAATVASDGRVVVVWNGGTVDCGSAAAGRRRHLVGRDADRGLEQRPAQPGGRRRGLWLVYEKGGDIWYRTSANQGDSSSGEVQFTRFVGGDAAPGQPRLRRAASASPGVRTAAATRISGSALPASGRISTRRPISNGSSIGPRPTRTATTPSPSAPARSTRPAWPAST